MSDEHVQVIPQGESQTRNFLVYASFPVFTLYSISNTVMEQRSSSWATVTIIFYSILSLEKFQKSSSKTKNIKFSAFN